MRTVVDFVSGSGNRPTWSVNGQHADFAFYGGTLAGSPGVNLFMALNSGLTGGVGILDFGTGGPAAGVTYDATATTVP